MSNISKTSCFKCGHIDGSKEKESDGDNKKEEKGWWRGREVKQQREVLEEASNDEMIERE